VAFLAVQPGMEHLAAQVAAGKPVSFPRRIGLFRIEAPAIAPVSGYVGLMIDSGRLQSGRGVRVPYRLAPTGFVRLPPDPNPNTHGPIVGVSFDVYLGGGWWYRG
jgi:hypothetical protein